jgi:adenine-specific DNA methylase
VKKLIKSLEQSRNHYIAEEQTSSARVILGDASELLSNFEPNSVDLIVTDPPHGDRIPYLELSELWNAILGQSVDYEHEIVVSNAHKRNKGPDKYAHDLRCVFVQLSRVLRPSGHLIILFNARDERSWSDLKAAVLDNGNAPLAYLGAFEVHYSAGSVVQDNRAGGLQHDYALVFKRRDGVLPEKARRLNSRPGWTTAWPAEAR